MASVRNGWWGGEERQQAPKEGAREGKGQEETEGGGGGRRLLVRFLSQADGQTGAALHPSIHLGLNLICRGERETEGSNVSDARVQSADTESGGGVLSRDRWAGRRNPSPRLPPVY